MSGSDLALPASQAIVAAPVRRRWESVLALGAYAYPVIFVSSFYLTWFAAWVALGRAPRPNLDDPKSIGPLVDVLYGCTMVCLMCAPGAMVFGAVMTTVAVGLKPASVSRRVLLGLVALVGLVLLWVAAFWFLRVDPWGVSTWYMD